MSKFPIPETLAVEDRPRSSSRHSLVQDLSFFHGIIQCTVEADTTRMRAQETRPKTSSGNFSSEGAASSYGAVACSAISRNSFCTWRGSGVASMIQCREKQVECQENCAAHLDQLADFQAFVVSLRIPSLAVFSEPLHFSLDHLARLDPLGKVRRQERLVRRQVVEKSRRDPDLRSMARRGVVETLFEGGDRPRRAYHLVVTCTGVPQARSAFH